MGDKALKKYLRYGYLILICSVLPLYMRQGYFELGEAKGLCYMILSAVFVPPVLIFSFKKLFAAGHLPGYMAYTLMAFLFSNLISLVFSVDKKTAFLGLEGWRSGFLTILMAIFFFYAFYEKEESLNVYVLSAALITPFLECVLAILNRIGIYPIDIYGQNPGFLATMGNINWFTAFLSVFAPLGIGLCFCQNLFSGKFFLCSAFALTTLLALFLQGSDSAFIVMGATYLVLLFFALSDRQEFRKFLALAFLLGLAAELGGILITLFRDGYVYQENLLMQVCQSHAGLILMALCLLIYRGSRLFEEIKLKWKSGLYRIIASVIAAAILGFCGFLFFRDPDYASGNGRILIYSICLDMFNGMDPVRKLFGVGQDCLSVYAYGDPVTADSLFNVFGFDTLTNAHCDLLTILIERGFLGVLTYLALLGSFLKRILEQKNKHAALVCALILFSFFMNSLVSFSLVISAPYFFLAMAVGLSLEKET
jgi:hypothetical protein